MYVVLDANIVISAAFGGSERFRFLLSAASAAGHTICVPTLVIEEVVSKFERDLEHRAGEVRKSLEALSKHLGRALPSPLSNLDHKKETALLRNRLTTQIAKSNCTILNYPNIPHRRVVQRAVERRRPFDEKGSGYRDTLIWESALGLARKVTDSVLLVSSDKDFCDRSDKLHPELVNELVRRGQAGKVTLARSLADLLDGYVRPSLKKVLETDPVQALAHLGIDLKDAIGLSVQDNYSGEEWQPEQLGLVPEYETLHLSTVEEVSNLKVVDAREVAAGEFLLKSEVTLECEFDAFVFKPDLYGMEDIRVYEYDWNKHYVLAGVTVALPCELDVNISISDEPDIEVLSLEPITDKS